MSRTQSLLRRLPDFYDADNPQSALHRLMSVFGEALDEVEGDLVRVLRSRWVDTADNEGSRGLNTTVKGDLDSIFSLYLESLGGTSRLRQHGRLTDEDDVFYRKRIRALIEVLRGGASTPAGILAVVAANLGIVGESKEARGARKRIRLVEFLPRSTEVVVAQRLTLSDTLEVDNPNPVDTKPRIRLSFLEDLTVALLNPRLVNLTTDGSVSYPGGIVPGDELVFFADGCESREGEDRAWLNGVDVPVDGALPSLPPGRSDWRFEADIGLPEGIFDLAHFDASVFQESRIESAALFAESSFDRTVFGNYRPVVELDMTLARIKPASFLVRIPWSLPGYTDGFEKSQRDPRHQIPHIINRVKAGGVEAEIAFEETFREEQGLEESFIVERAFFEKHQLSEADLALSSVQTPEAEEHEHEDRLWTAGAFGLTTFDSLNTFA